MTNATHTPGPWKISNSAAGKTGTSLFIWRNDPGNNEDNTGYARICQHIHNEYNARLIAAAPELLEALKDASKRMHNAALVYNMEPDKTQWSEWALEIDLVIAKAEGK